MCKHVAAVLYGVGARLDQQPELLFRLRRVDAQDLVSQAGAGLPRSKTGPAASKVLDTALLADVFGIEMDEPAPTTVPRKKKPASVKAPAKKAPSVASKTAAQANRKPRGTPTVAVVKKPALPKSTAKEPVRARQSASSKLPATKVKAAVTTSVKKKPVKAAGAEQRSPAKKG